MWLKIPVKCFFSSFLISITLNSYFFYYNKKSHTLNPITGQRMALTTQFSNKTYCAGAVGAAGATGACWYGLP